MTDEKGSQIAESFYGNKVVKYLLLALAVLLAFPNSLFSNYYLCTDFQPDRIEQCLDQSWHTALNLALEKSFIFGRDFVFTYGPLGFLSTRADIGISGFYLLLFDLFVAANVAYIVWFVWKKYYNIAAILLCLLLCYLSPFADASFKLLIIMVFHLCRSLEKPSAKHFIVPFVVTLLSFFIKLNTSFPAIFIFYIFLGASLLIHKKLDYAKIILAIIFPVCLILCCRIFNVAFFGYLANGWQLIDGYNDTMNYISPSFAKYDLLVAFSAFSSLLGFAVLFFKDRKNFAFAVILLTFAALLFVLFKQSMVRSDGTHLFAYFYFAPVLWLFCLLFVPKTSNLAKKLTVAFSFLILIAGILPLRYDVKAAEFSPLKRFNYAVSLFRDENIEAKNRSFENFRLPPEIIEIIGRKSVDIIPHNVDLIYFNNLNYAPRPVFQTYAVFTEKLLQLNRQKYEGDSAPEFVIFSNETNDNRYGFFDDAGAKIALLENYSVVKKFDFQDNDYLLFQKNTNKKIVILGEAKTAAINFYQDYMLEDLNKTYFVKVNIDYSLLGNASKFLYQPLILKMIFNLDDGTTREFRAVVPIVKSGVLINPFVETDADYESFFKGETIPLKKIKSLRFEPFYDNKFQKLNLLNYREPFKLELHEFSVN